MSLGQSSGSRKELAEVWKMNREFGTRAVVTLRYDYGYGYDYDYVTLGAAQTYK